MRPIYRQLASQLFPAMAYTRRYILIFITSIYTIRYISIAEEKITQLPVSRRARFLEKEIIGGAAAPYFHATTGHISPTSP